MKVEVVSKEKLAYSGTNVDGAAITMDVPAKRGGGTGPTPVETMLLALGSCIGMSVEYGLKKMKAEPESLRIELDAEPVDTRPKTFKKIKVHITISGPGITPEKMEKAIKLSEEQYCSVSASLKKSIEIEYTFEIIQKEDIRKD